MARMAQSYGDGIEAVVGIYRGDTWGAGLYNSFVENFEEMGGTEIEAIQYDPEKTEFGAEADLLNGYVDDARDAGFTNEQIALMYVGFQTEGSALLNTIANYENLININWLGSDGTGFAQFIIEEAGENAVKVRVTSTLMHFTKTSTYFDFAEKFQAQTAEMPDIYYANAYDAAWLLGKSILISSSVDPVVVRAALPMVAEQHMGASGWCKMNEYGDRFGADFNIWAVVTPEEAINPGSLHPVPNETGWELVGFYNINLDAVTWYVETPMSVGG